MVVPLWGIVSVAEFSGLMLEPAEQTGRRELLIIFRNAVTGRPERPICFLLWGLRRRFPRAKTTPNEFASKLYVPEGHHRRWKPWRRLATGICDADFRNSRSRRVGAPSGMKMPRRMGIVL